jgi:hypothetical protein
MAEEGKQWVFFLVGFLILSVIFGIPIAEKVGEIHIGSKIIDLSGMEGFSRGIGEYVFGVKDTINFQGADLTPYATIVIFMMLWLIVFVSFGDIMETFSTFNPGISWLIAFCLAIIGGMTGIYNGAVGKAVVWLAGFGTWALVVGALFAFGFFLLIESGLGGLSPKIRRYILNRKLSQEAMGVRGKLMRAGQGAEALAEFEKEVAKT